MKISTAILATIIAGFSSVSLAQDLYCHDGSKLSISAFNSEITFIKHNVEYKGTYINNEVNWGNAPKEVGLPKRIEAIVFDLFPHSSVIFVGGLVCDQKTTPKEMGSEKNE